MMSTTAQEQARRAVPGNASLLAVIQVRTRPGACRSLLPEDFPDRLYPPYRRVLA
jgi:hypothetical protein